MLALENFRVVHCFLQLKSNSNTLTSFNLHSTYHTSKMTHFRAAQALRGTPSQSKRRTFQRTQVPDQTMISLPKKRGKVNHTSQPRLCPRKRWNSEMHQHLWLLMFIGIKTKPLHLVDMGLLPKPKCCRKEVNKAKVKMCWWPQTWFHLLHQPS